MSNKTLGEVIRFMVGEAIKSDSKSFHAPVMEIYKLVNGRGYPELDAEDYADTAKVRASREIAGLKSSYIYNTVTRMQELRDINMRAKHRFIWLDDDGEECQPGKFDNDGATKHLVIELVDGAIMPKAKRKDEDEKRRQAINTFKARISKVMPDVSDYDSEQMIGAMKAIKAMKVLIEEMS